MVRADDVEGGNRMQPHVVHASKHAKSSPPVSSSSKRNKTSAWKCRTARARKVFSLSLLVMAHSRKHTSATISAVDDDGTRHAGCMLDLPSAHCSNLLNSSMRCSGAAPVARAFLSRLPFVVSLSLSQSPALLFPRLFFFP